MSLIIEILCFVAVSLILHSLGSNALSWQYFAMVVVMLIYKLTSLMD